MGSDRIKALEKEKTERHEAIIYAAITTLIILIIFSFILLSRTVLVTEKFLRTAGVIVILLAIEFLNFFAHPLLEKLTNHSIPLMFSIMVVLAYLLGSFHHKMDKKIQEIVLKNNKLKEAFAHRILKKKDDGLTANGPGS